MNVIAWRTWYWEDNDPVQYTSREYEPEELPSIGMIGVVQYYDECISCDTGRHYRDIVHGADWYLWDGERWTSVPSHPIKGRWVELGDVQRIHPDKLIIKSAPQISDSEWQIMHGMMRDAVETP